MFLPRQYVEEVFEREDAAKVATITSVCVGESVKESKDPVPADDVTMSNSRLQNSNVLANLGKKLCHLSEPQQQQVTSLILDFVDLFPDTPGKTSCSYHDVDVMCATPIKQHPYHVNPMKLQLLRKEVE